MGYLRRIKKRNNELITIIRQERLNRDIEPFLIINNFLKYEDGLFELKMS